MHCNLKIQTSSKIKLKGKCWFFARINYSYVIKYLLILYVMLGMFFCGSRKEKKIAITFDDGPSEETEKILDILKKYDARATFFIWGERIKGRESILRRIKKERHEFGNHTYSHKRLWFKSREFIKKDIEKCDEELCKVGIKTNLFRFPGFKFGLNSLMICWKLNKKIIFADMISNDWLNPWLKKRYNRKSPVRIEKVVKKTLLKTKNGSILNFHDYLEGIGTHKEIISIFEKIMPELEIKGFKFVTVSELLFSKAF